MFVVTFGFPGIEKLNNYLLHVLNVKVPIGINQKEPNNDWPFQILLLRYPDECKKSLDPPPIKGYADVFSMSSSSPKFCLKRSFLFEDVKSLLEMAIKAERPVHLLLCGPPSSGKSLFMSSLTRLERWYYAVGSNSTKSGIFDYLFEYRPRYFIIDELEKMNRKDQTSLLNLMESGILSELKHNQQRTTQLKTWIFASCNRS